MAQARSDFGRYQLRLKGHLSPGLAEWLGAEIHNEPNGEALLVVTVADQAALHGLLAKIRDLGLPLLAVQPGDRHS